MQSWGQIFHQCWLFSQNFELTQHFLFTWWEKFISSILICAFKYIFIVSFMVENKQVV